MAYTQIGYGYGGNSAPSSGANYLGGLGFGGLINSAQQDVGSLLNGLPSPSTTRTANAYFGAGTGLGTGSDFLRNRGYDLYGQQSQQRQQTGLQDLNSLMSGVSSPELSNQGQQLQNTQFNANLNQQGDQYSQDLQLKKFLANLQAIGLGREITTGNSINIPQFNA